ncbi:hypothetical protein ACFPMF_13145 [Larkinella bovis]|uniref:Response regulator n=1 Tax=Larkinella bovis TaxID=683041 RepID=A0ABW0ICK7_9BACT
MSSSVEIATRYVVMITRVSDHRVFVVPGMETYLASYPVVVYNSTKLLIEKLLRPTTVLPDLIVVDLSKSPDDGLTFLREMKNHNRLRSIPVLMRRISADSSRGQVLPIRKWGEITQPALTRERPLLIAS